MRRSHHGVAPLETPLLHQARERLFERERPGLARDRDLLMKMLKRVRSNMLPRAGHVR